MDEVMEFDLEIYLKNLSEVDYLEELSLTFMEYDMSYGVQIFEGTWKNTRLHDKNIPETWETKEEGEEVLKREIPGWLLFTGEEFPGAIRINER